MFYNIITYLSYYRIRSDGPKENDRSIDRLMEERGQVDDDGGMENELHD